MTSGELGRQAALGRRRRQVLRLAGLRPGLADRGVESLLEDAPGRVGECRVGQRGRPAISDDSRAPVAVEA